MADKLIIIHSDDSITNADYDGYESLQKAVGGLAEYFHNTKIVVEPMLCDGKEVLPLVLFCNEEFLIDDDPKFDKVNAVATLISGKEIRGDVAVVVDSGDGDSRGFQYKEYAEEGCEPEEDLCECWAVEDSLMKFANSYRKELQDIHKKYDNNKSEPRMEFIAF